MHRDCNWKTYQTRDAHILQWAFLELVQISQILTTSSHARADALERTVTPPKSGARVHKWKMATPRSRRGRPRKNADDIFGRGIRINKQAKCVVLNVYNYFKKLESKSKSKGAFEKTMDATGITRSSLSMIVEENKTKGKIESPSKRYKKSRKTVIADDFDKDAIRRRTYRIYEKKEHITLSKLLVCIGVCTCTTCKFS